MARAKGRRLVPAEVIRQLIEGWVWEDYDRESVAPTAPVNLEEGI